LKGGRQQRFMCGNCHQVLYVKKTPSPAGD
jgi:hypothetical protein